MTTPYWTRVCSNAIIRKRNGKIPFTCACGKQDPRIPRITDGINPGQPMDIQLAVCGAQFSKAVANQTPAKAQGILNRVEFEASRVTLNYP